MTRIKQDSKTGTFYFVLDAGKDPLTNKRKQIKRRFKTRDEAIAGLAKLKEEIKEGRLVTNSKVTFGHFSKEWLDNKRLSLRQTTLVNYEEQFKYNIDPYMKDIRLCDLNVDILQNHIKWLNNERKLAPATIHNVYGIVSEIVLSANKKNLIYYIPIDEVVLPAYVKKTIVWNEDQINQFMNAPNVILNLTRYFIGFEILLHTGLRLGEVLALRWKDIDFNNNLIRVQQTLAKTDSKGNFEIRPQTKTVSSTRMVYVSDTLLESLTKHRERLDKERKVLGDKYIDLDIIVAQTDGKWLHPNNFRRAFKSLCKQLDLPALRLHDCRHTHATFLMSKHVNPRVVQERLGHKNIKTTLGRYSHVLPSMQIEASKKFDEILQ